MIHNSYLIKMLWSEAASHDIRNTLLVFLTVLTVVRIVQKLLRILNDNLSLPPGPWGLPVAGYLMFMGSEKHTRFMELAKQYGSIFSARLGNQLTVVMSDYKMIRELFRKDEFTGRPDTPFLRILNGFGIVNSTGKLWKDQRRFLHQKLRSFGMTYMGSGKKIMEHRIMKEVSQYLDVLYASNGEPIDLSPAISVSVSNVICNIMMSVRFDIDDPRFRHFTGLIEEGMRLFGQIHTVEYIPTFQYLPGNKIARGKLAENRQEMFDFYRKVIEEHRATFDPNNIRDLVDTYLDEIQKAKENGSEGDLFDGKDHDEQIMQVISDLFTAGMETIKTTLLWINVFMLRNPEVMRRVQNEMDQVVGRGRLPSIEDLPYLTTTETTILEVMRCSTIVPLATTHSPTSDFEMNGYKIPAGSHVIPLINSVHMDPTLWDKPEEFNPSRFLDGEGKVRRPEYFMPFGVGRRMCLGDVLARMELFLFFASFMHTFDMRLPEGEAMPSLKGNVGVTISPQSFKVCLTPRPFTCDPMHPHVRNVGSY